MHVAVKMISTVFQVVIESTNRTSINVRVSQLVQMVVLAQLMNVRIVFFDLFFDIDTLIVSYTSVPIQSKPLEVSAVLILNTALARHRPLLTDVNGREDYEFFFLYRADTEVDGSCSLMWQNEAYIFGGLSEKRQISKVGGCSLTRIGSLPFTFANGACTVNQGTMYLCFPDRN